MSSKPYILLLLLTIALSSFAQEIPVNGIWMSPNQTTVFDRTVYGTVIEKRNLYINISKPKRTLFVIEKRLSGDVLIAAYPVCLGANSGDKKRKGDCRTPESKPGRPFTICQISDASHWHHDFGDGRGPMPAYGHWFMRLKGDYVGSGIGIHGSTGNHYSVPGRGSEGCIRLRDDDIVHLKKNYAFIGMKVFIEKDE
ncbi:MAG: L,D-transpeptidase [Bacteroidales bacterium]|nr:L,D-transpeptidase [Bacteroidales bacterium]